MSSYDLTAWLQLLVRWAHVFAAMLWIGQTYLFNRFERAVQPPLAAPTPPASPGAAEPPGDPAGGGLTSHVEGHVWMIHGGGFWLAEKHAPSAAMPPQLHWFK